MTAITKQVEDNDFPGLYKAASKLSADSQSIFFLCFATHMILLALAAAISVINSPDPAVAIIQSVTLLGALFCAVYLFLGRPDQDWYTGRAVAESIKTMCWRYMARAEPFNRSDAEATLAFTNRLDTIRKQGNVAGKLNTHLTGVPISAAMDALRASLIDNRKAQYCKFRIEDQQYWYAAKAAFNNKRVKIFFVILLATLFASICLSIAKVRYPTAPYWPTDLFVTVSAGLLSWIQAKRFQELSASYSVAAQEISLILQHANRPMSEDELSSFIGDAENAFSREHTLWIARKDV